MGFSNVKIFLDSIDIKLKELSEEENKLIDEMSKETNTNETPNKEQLRKYLKLCNEYNNLYQNSMEEAENLKEEATFDEIGKLPQILQELSMNSLFAHNNYFRYLMADNMSEMYKIKRELKDHDKNILNMMGIFLAIFSLIGINISFFTSTFSNSSGKSIEICEFLKYLLGVNVILVLSITLVFELIKHYTKDK